MPLGWLLSRASDMAAPVAHAVDTLLASPSQRRMSRSEERVHLELRGTHESGTDIARAVENRLNDRTGVHDAEVNAVLGRVVVDHDSQLVDVDQLAGIVAEVEAEYGLDQHGPAPGSAAHPANADTLLREVGALGTSLVGLGYASIGAVLPVPGVSPLVPAVTSLVDSVPWLRTQCRDRLGPTVTDTALTLGGAATQSLAGSPLGVFVDACGRWSASREAIARHQAWQRWDAIAAPGHHRSEPVSTEPRPTVLADGPVERVSNFAGGAALAGYAAVLASTRDPQRALAALLAGIPRPAKAGREAFSTQMSVTLSNRDALVLDPEALRRLDRVDTVVIDSDVLVTGGRSIDSVTLINTSADASELFDRATALVDPLHPTRRHERDGWTTGPLSDFALPEDVRDLAHQQRARGADVAVLGFESTPIALVTVAAELDPLAEAWVEAARSSAEVVVGGVSSKLDRRLRVERLVAGGTHLASSVRELQAEGRTVAVVSTRSAAALTASDVGIGVQRDTPPWSADVVCPDGASTHLLLSSVQGARSASRQAAGLSTAGSSVAALFAAFGPSAGAPARASLPIQCATLGAVGAGTWIGMQTSRQPPPVPQQRTPWHAMPPETVLNVLSTSERGLSASSAADRTTPRNENAPRTGIVSATVEGLINPMTPVLGAGAAVSAALGSALDAVLITGVLAVSATVDGVQRVATDRELAHLLDAGQLPVRLRRDDEVSTVPADQLVPGDIVEFQAGDGVPADCRVLAADRLELDESSLTGESQLVSKSVDATTASTPGDRTSMLYQGTAVASGTATAVVVATGASTELGRTTQEAQSSPGGNGGVEARMSELTKQILPISVGAGTVLFGVDLLRRNPVGETIGRAVGLAVAAVPEGLPFVATLAELAAARRLSRRGVLVRSPSTIEALGRVDALCFDKTGTLTQGRITLREVSDGRSSRRLDGLHDWHRRVVTTAARASPRPNGEPVPHLTDRAVLDGAEELGLGANGSELHAELPFEPSRGFHAARSDQHLNVKGAPEVLLDRCTGWRDENGVTAFDAHGRAAVEAEIERLALLGYRVLAVAERSASDRAELEEDDVDDLDFIGLLGLADPVHPTAADAVGRLQRSGVDVVMITGDHPSTAEAIASELDMLRGKRVMVGGELDDLDDDQLDGELGKIAVFARVSPAQKARIVTRLRAGDTTVAMTGDGANDVPAIGLAHVGIAFGSRATSAAREAADLVVADDTIETLTDGIVEGRGMWMSVHDALSVLLGGNLGEIGYSVGAGLFGAGAALNTRQLLLVNMLTDVLPAIAIAVRPPPDATPEKLLSEGPDVSLGRSLTRDVYARAAVTSAAAGVAWVAARPIATVGQARTTGLVALVAAQMTQTLAVRGRTPLVLAAGLGSLCILGTVVQVPGVSHFFGSRPLLPHQWAIAVATAVLAAVAMLLWQRFAPAIEP